MCATTHARWLPLALLSAWILPVATLPVLAGTYAVKDENVERIAPDERHAVVYLLRTTNLGAVVYFWTFADEALLGITRGKCYAASPLAPGDYTIWSRAENVSAIRLRVEAGRTYFLKQVVLPGFGKARVRLEVLSAAEGEAALGKLRKISRPTDEGREEATSIAARLLDLARRRAAGEEPRADSEEERPADEEPDAQ